MSTKIRSLKVSLLFGVGLFMAASSAWSAPKQEAATYLVGGTLHTGDGVVIENSVVGIKDGRISFVGAVDETSLDDPSDVLLIDVSGKVVTPALPFFFSVDWFAIN